jgi:hypothetical protein
MYFEFLDTDGLFLGQIDPVGVGGPGIGVILRGLDKKLIEVVAILFRFLFEYISEVLPFKFLFSSDHF